MFRVWGGMFIQLYRSPEPGDERPLSSSGELSVPEEGPKQDQRPAPADGGRPEDSRPSRLLHLHWVDRSVATPSSSGVHRHLSLTSSLRSRHRSAVPAAAPGVPGGPAPAEGAGLREEGHEGAERSES